MGQEHGVRTNNRLRDPPTLLSLSVYSHTLWFCILDNVYIQWAYVRMSRHLISISKEARLDAHAQCIPIDYNVNGLDGFVGKDHRYMFLNNYFGTDGVITHLQFFHSTWMFLLSLQYWAILFIFCNKLVKNTDFVSLFPNMNQNHYKLESSFSLRNLQN